MGCPCSGHDNSSDRPRKDSSIAIDIDDKQQLIAEAAAVGMNLKDYLAKILHEKHWGRK